MNKICYFRKSYFSREKIQNIEWKNKILENVPVLKQITYVISEKYSSRERCYLRIARVANKSKSMQWNKWRSEGMSIQWEETRLWFSSDAISKLLQIE